MGIKFQKTNSKSQTSTKFQLPNDPNEDPEPGTEIVETLQR
jgi:hypothetical protein